MASLRVFLSAVILFLNLSVNVYSGPVSESREDFYHYDFYSRDDWNAAPSTDKRPLKLPAPFVVVHHTYIPGACYDLQECKVAMRGMQNYHNSLDWGDIGYNFCLGSDGGAFEGRGWDNIGIHAGSANNYSIGICLIGDWRVELPPKKQLETLKAIIKTGVLLGKIREDYKLIGHNQAMSTECPGAALFSEISTWKHFAPGRPDFQHVEEIPQSFNKHNDEDVVVFKD